MNRRDMIKAAILGGAVMIFGQGRAWAKEYFPVQVDETLWLGKKRGLKSSICLSSRHRAK